MLSEAVQAALDKEMAAALAPGLYLVATPIGNLADISLRALAVLARADRVFCEDTRHSQKLTGHYGLAVRLLAYHDHNAARERPRILKWLAEGASVALISDAGTPLISDPGYKLVREAALQGTPVFSIPGASAVLAGLAASGLPTDSFFFAGFLPPRQAAARIRLEALTEIPGTLIFFETAGRLDKTLRTIGDLFAGRELVIARELTKRFEEFIRAPLPAPQLIGSDWKGEFVLLVSPPSEQTATEADIQAAIVEALTRSSLRDAVEDVRRTLRVPRRQVYDLALKHQKGSSCDDVE